LQGVKLEVTPVGEIMDRKVPKKVGWLKVKRRIEFQQNGVILGSGVNDYDLD